MNLEQLGEAQTASISDYAANMQTSFKNRLQDLGFCIGEPVTCLKRVPFGGPHVYCVAGAEFSLDRALARQITLHELT